APGHTRSGGEAGAISGEAHLLGPITTQLGASLPHLGLPVPLRAPALDELALGDLGVMMMHRLPRRSRLVDVGGGEAPKERKPPPFALLRGFGAPPRG